MKQPIRLLLLLCFVVLSCGPDKEQQAAEEKENSKTYILFVDMTSSAQDKNVRVAYKEAVRSIMKSMKPADIIVSGIINDQSLNEKKLPVNFTFPTLVYKTENELYRQAEEENFNKNFARLKDSITDCINNLIGQPASAKGTDIFGAALLAEKIFSNYNKENKVLIILSDMLQCSKEADFEKIIPQTDSEANEIINILKADKKLPDLNGAKIYAVGVNAPKLSNYINLQEFWVTYFKECKAVFSKDKFTSSLINFEE